MKHGIDLSHWNNLQDLWALPTDFVIAKLTEGISMVDHTAYTYYLYTKNFEIPFGVYHFARPRKRPDTTGAVAEARHFLEAYAKFNNPSIVVALDYEEFIDDATPNDAWAVSFLQEVKSETAVKPLLYCSQSKCKIFTEASKLSDLWVARYNRQMELGDISPWSQPLIWQYDSKGIDTNILFEKGDNINEAKKFIETKRR